MSTFDTVRMQVPISVPFAPTEFQTKDLDCSCSTYTLTAYGRLVDERGFNVDYEGGMFLKGYWQGRMDNPVSITLLAWFEHNQLVRITLPGLTSVGGPYEHGIRSGEMGVSLDFCPYDAGSYDAATWEEGYHEGYLTYTKS